MPDNQTEPLLMVETPTSRHLENCSKILTYFNAINCIIEELEPIIHKFERSVSKDEQKSLTKEVDTKYKVIKQHFKDIDIKLKNLETAVSVDSDIIDDQDKEVIKSNIQSAYKTLENKLKDTQNFYSNFKSLSKKKLVRQIRNLDNHNQFTEEQIDIMAEQNPDAVHNLVQEKLFGKASLMLQYEAQDIIEKCEGIKKLQKNIRELLDMLKDVSKVVMIQGEQINSIAEHVNMAKDYVAKGNEYLNQAKKHHNDSKVVGLLEAMHYYSIACRYFIYSAYGCVNLIKRKA